MSFSLPQMMGPYRAADYLKLPEGEPVELIRGEQVVPPAANMLHQAISAILLNCLLAASLPSGGVVVASPIDVVLADESNVQPDLV